MKSKVLAAGNRSIELTSSQRPSDCVMEPASTPLDRHFVPTGLCGFRNAALRIALYVLSEINRPCKFSLETLTGTCVYISSFFPFSSFGFLLYYLRGTGSSVGNNKSEERGRFKSTCLFFLSLWLQDCCLHLLTIELIKKKVAISQSQL